jgi:hypothetical protein
MGERVTGGWFTDTRDGLIPSLASVNISTLGDNTVVGSLSASTVLVYRIVLTAASSVTVTFKDGAGASLSGPITLAAGVPLVLPFDANALFATSTGNGFVINLGSAVRVSGTVLFTQPGAGGTPGVVLDSSVINWINAVIANGGTVSSARRTLVNTMVVGMKADGVWAKLDGLWIFAGENTPSALTDMVATRLASTAVSAPAFTIDRGYTGNGTANFVDTTWNPVTNAVNFSNNSAHWSVWSLTAGAIGTFDFGNVYGDNGNHILCEFTDTNAYFRINSTNAGPTNGPSPGTGHFIGSRTSAVQVDGYRNGASIGTSGADAESNPESRTVWACGCNDGITPVFSTRQQAMCSAGGGLTAADATNFYNRLRTYMSAIGVP